MILGGVNLTGIVYCSSDTVIHMEYKNIASFFCHILSSLMMILNRGVYHNMFCWKTNHTFS